MKLSEKERKILKIVHLRADMSMPEIAREAGYREHTVRHCLQSLQERKIIRRTVFINHTALGLTRLTMLFSLKAASNKVREKFVENVKSSEQVVFASELGGDFQYKADLLVRNAGDIVRFVDAVSTGVQGAIFDKSFAMHLAFHLFGAKYLYPQIPSRPSLSWQVSTAPESIDENDHKILYLLGNGDFPSTSEIARKLKLPVSTVDYRIKRLEHKKIIEGHFLIVDAKLFGMAPFELLIQTRVSSEKINKRIFEFARKHPHIDILIPSVGNWDYLMFVPADMPQRVTAVAQEVYAEFGDEIVSVRILPVLDVHKRSGYPLKEFAFLPR